MRTKTLIVAAALTVAGIASVQAQSNVYSVNVVGYYNVVVPQVGAGNLRMVGNQLKAADNSLNALMPNVPADTVFLHWGGANFASSTFIGPADGWDPPYPLPLGGGGFLRNVKAFPITVTFVGEVAQGSLTNPIAANIDIKSSMVPQAGAVDSVLGLPAITDEVLLRWKTTVAGGYLTHTFIGPADGWDPIPSVEVGEAFFLTKAGPAQNWIRVFTIP